MKNIIIKTIFGILFTVTGFILFSIFMDYISKPNNRNIILDPIESLNNYFFAFSYGLGIVGTIFGGLILIGIISLFFLLGFWLSGKIALLIKSNFNKRKTRLSQTPKIV